MTLDSERYKKKGKLWSLIQRIFVKKKVKKVDTEIKQAMHLR